MTREGDNESDDIKQAMAMLKKAGYKVSKAVEEESTTTRDNRAERAGRKVAKDIEYDEKKKDGIHGKKRGSEDAKAEKAGKKVAKDIEYDEKKKKVKEQGGADTPTASSGFSYGIWFWR
jgi:Mrp family chromosome partitioning ATPase